MRNRSRNLQVRVDDHELAKLQALAEDRDETVSAMLRRWTRERFAERFGMAQPHKEKSR